MGHLAAYPCHMTATGYVRLSKTAGATNLSLAGMVRDVEALADRLGQPLLKIHVDDGLSGAIRNRPAFTAWLDDILSGRADVALTHSVDRLTREGVNVAGMILDALEGKDPRTGKLVRAAARLVDCAGLDSAQGDEAFRWSFLVKAEIGRSERERMRTRVKDRNRRAADLGFWSGGPVPYGFTVIDKRLVPDPVEQPLVEWMAHRVISGDSLRSIARQLNHAGHKPRRAAGWSGWNINSLLRKHGASHLVPPDLLLAARQALDLKAYARPTGRPRVRLMSGLLRCSTCGSPMQVSVDSYRCNLTWCPKRVAVSIARTDEHFTALFLDTFGNVPTFTATTAVTDHQLKALQADLTASKARLISELTDEAMSAVRAAQAAIDAYQEAPVRTSIQYEPTDMTMAETWHAATDDAARRELLGSWIDYVSVLPGVRHKHGLNISRFDVHTHDEVDAEHY